jgi:enoyl-CoA hydratase
MGYENILVEAEGNIGTITLNRPKALNALNSQMLGELRSAAAELESNDAVKVVIITGAERAFAAGADIAEMMPMSTLEGQRHAKLGQDTLAAFENMGKPVIAAVNGFALGGGCELAMACDIRLASEKAKFGQPEVKLGIMPGFGGTQRLPRLVGRAKAKELIFTGEMIDAAEAHRIGLVNAVYPPDALMEEARKMADLIAQNGEIAVTLAKRAINRGIEVDLNSGCALEAEVFSLCFSTEDQKEGMKAFVEKRPAKFKGR